MDDINNYAVYTDEFGNLIERRKFDSNIMVHDNIPDGCRYIQHMVEVHGAPDMLTVFPQWFRQRYYEVEDVQTTS